MMSKIGLTPGEIQAININDAVDREWLREVAWQLAKLNERVDLALPRPIIQYIGETTSDRSKIQR